MSLNENRHIHRIVRASPHTSVLHSTQISKSPHRSAVHSTQISKSPHASMMHSTQPTNSSHRAATHETQMCNLQNFAEEPHYENISAITQSIQSRLNFNPGSPAGTSKSPRVPIYERLDFGSRNHLR